MSICEMINRKFKRGGNEGKLKIQREGEIINVGGRKKREEKEKGTLKQY